MVVTQRVLIVCRVVSYSVRMTTHGRIGERRPPSLTSSRSAYCSQVGLRALTVGLFGLGTFETTPQQPRVSTESSGLPFLCSFAEEVRGGGLLKDHNAQTKRKPDTLHTTPRFSLALRRETYSRAALYSCRWFYLSPSLPFPFSLLFLRKNFPFFLKRPHPGVLSYFSVHRVYPLHVTC